MRENLIRKGGQLVLIVGELINTSRKAVKEAVAERNEAFIADLARRQTDAGANYLDVNCGTMLENEKDSMEWLVQVVSNAVPTPLCIDSPDPEVIDAGLALCKGRKTMINSTTLEKVRYGDIVPLARKYGSKLIALCIDDKGMPEHADDRVEIANALIRRLEEDGLGRDDIYIDPLVKPISVDVTQGLSVLDAVSRIMKENPGVHTICGLTNISFNLPERMQLNRTFMIQTMARGMDSYIIDITNRQISGALFASAALLGQDRFCRKYIKAYRNGIFAENQI